MGTIFAVVGSNLTVAYSEVKMFALLPQIYPRDFVDCFVRNYFRFCDDIFHTWLINFDIEPFYILINELDSNLKFIFEKLTIDINYLGVNIKIIDNKLHFDIYHLNQPILLITSNTITAADLTQRAIFCYHWQVA